jgi:HlyD family secretion protein
MLLFKKFTFWLALAGVFLTAKLVLRLSTTVSGPMTAPTLEPARKPFPASLGAAGLVEATHENTHVGTPAAGLVASVEARVWDRVTKGQILFRIEDRELRALLLPQIAQCAVAKATRERLQGQVKRLAAVEDPRAIVAEDLEVRRAELTVAEAQLEAAIAAVSQTQALLDRLTVRAPIDGTVLQVNIRAGENITPSSATAPLILGSIDELQVRVDVDEQLAPRVRPSAPAVGFIKGDASHPIPLEFVRIEPVIIPKRSLTGASIERVDTRILQVIFRFPLQKDRRIYVGQQMDVFIEEKP